MKTLVTGVPGWLGSRLTSVLTNPNDPLNHFSGYSDREVRCFVLPGMNATGINHAEIIAGDVRDADSLHRALDGVETVFHLVGIIHPKKISDLYAVNREGFRNLLNAAEAAGVRRVVFVSSNSPAGTNKNRNILMKESDTPQPYKHYGISKLEAEQIGLDFVKRGRIEVVIVRPCWFYGPGQPDRQTRFFRMIKSGKPLMFGDGKIFAACRMLTIPSRASFWPRKLLTSQEDVLDS